jgi:glycosyltransferase involved in cell wall biosynthesis
MRFLFLHPNFPGQFRHLATVLGQDPKHQVVFGTMRAEGQIAGVRKVLYQPSREAKAETHPYLRSSETAILQGQAAYRLGAQLKAQGFVPDVIYGSSGWGPTLFMKDLFPQAKLCCYFEWFYHAHGSDVDFDPASPVDADTEARLRIKNLPILTDMWSCDRGLTPTRWQHQQFPKEFRNKITVRHDGVDTSFFKPNPGHKLVLPELGLDLSEAKEIVTYATRGMEPYRGFPQFMAAAALIQQRRPNCHIVVAGEDRVAYGKALPDGKTYKQQALETLPLDLSRLHFTGRLPYPDYLQVLQASSVHVYLTYPFVLSWSLLEAMATGCRIVASDTSPVKEVIEDGRNGLLVDFYDIAAIADRVDAVLDGCDRYDALRSPARETIQQRYDLAKLLPQHLHWLTQAGEPELATPKSKSSQRRKAKGFSQF